MSDAITRLGELLVLAGARVCAVSIEPETIGVCKDEFSMSRDKVTMVPVTYRQYGGIWETVGVMRPGGKDCEIAWGSGSRWVLLSSVARPQRGELRGRKKCQECGGWFLPKDVSAKGAGFPLCYLCADNDAFTLDGVARNIGPIPAFAGAAGE